MVINNDTVQRYQKELNDLENSFLIGLDLEWASKVNSSK